MSLSHFQKKYIRTNIRSSSLSEISQKLQLPEQEIIVYLKDVWRTDKFEKFMKGINGKNSDDGQNILLIEKLKEFSFSLWIKNTYNWSSLLFLTFLVIIAYFNSLHNVFLSDDLSGIVQNRAISSFKYVTNQPLSFLRGLEYYLAFKFGGLDPLYFRIFNILQHFANTYLVFFLFGLLSTYPIAFLGASLFAIHPILVESVTWVSGGGYSLYTLFFLISFISYILSYRYKFLYLISLLCYAFSFGASPAAIPLVGTFFMFEFLFGNLKTNWKRLMPFAILSFYAAYRVIGGIGSRAEAQKIQYYQEANFQNPFISIPVAVSAYLELFLWPDKLTLYHSEMAFTPLSFMLRAVTFITYIGISLYFFFKNRLVFFWMVFFLISLAVTLVPTGLSWVVAERYVYAGTIGLIFIVAYFVNKLSQNKKTVPLYYLIFILLITALIVRTIMRNYDWKNEDNLWLSAARTSPSSPTNHNNLGDVYYRHKDYERAIKEFKIAIALKPNYADVYHNIGNVYVGIGNYGEALRYYKKASEMNPLLWQSFQNIGIIYYNQSKLREAEISMKKALELHPGEPTLYSSLGVIYLTMNEKQKARGVLEKGLALVPDDKKIKELLVQALQ